MIDGLQTKAAPYEHQTLWQALVKLTFDLNSAATIED
jgi:hypothetical protein